MTFPALTDVVTFVNELPLLGLVPDTRRCDPQRGSLDVKDAVAHPAKRFAESGLLGSLIAVAELHRRFAQNGDLVEVADADCGGVRVLPPARYETSPDRAFGIRRLEHLVDVAEEARHAGDIEDAAHDPRPGLETPDDCVSSRHAGRNPGSA